MVLWTESMVCLNFKRFRVLESHWLFLASGYFKLIYYD